MNPLGGGPQHWRMSQQVTIFDAEGKCEQGVAGLLVGLSGREWRGACRLGHGVGDEVCGRSMRQKNRQWECVRRGAVGARERRAREARWSGKKGVSCGLCPGTPLPTLFADNKYYVK